MARPKSLMPAGTLDLLDGVPEASGAVVSAAIEAAGLTLDQAAQLMELSGRQALSKILGAGTTRLRLAVLLLATGQHPAIKAVER